MQGTAPEGHVWGWVLWLAFQSGRSRSRTCPGMGMISTEWAPVETEGSGPRHTPRPTPAGQRGGGGLPLSPLPLTHLKWCMSFAVWCSNNSTENCALYSASLCTPLVFPHTMDSHSCDFALCTRKVAATSNHGPSTRPLRNRRQGVRILRLTQDEL